MQNSGINRRFVLALIGGVLMPADAKAVQYPSRPIKIIVPFGPGGSGDITVRLTRAPATPDVPAVAETFPGFQLTGSLGMNADYLTEVPINPAREVS